MNHKIKRILDKKYGHYLAQLNKAQRGDDNAKVRAYNQAIAVVRELYLEISGLPIDWEVYEDQIEESVYYSLA